MVSAGTGELGVSILWLSEVESLICNFFLSLAAQYNFLSRSAPEIRPARMLLALKANKQPVQGST